MAERFGGTVDSITMGPPQAAAIIQEAVCMGVEEALQIAEKLLGKPGSITVIPEGISTIIC